ncbi:RNA recognition motif domain [Fusarium oxysporum f. sp. vasinfectum]|nr:RNA recognition motif domain [Fusarium oxysporum f. sp. vasinfectum]
MSSQAPQVLSRRANGGPQTSSNQTSEPTKGKGPHENSSHGKARGRGSNARSTEANKHANESETPKPTKTKAHNEGEKLVIRRLPPGMTQAEFVSILGSEWELGKGKVDWFSFAGGKISTDPSKPSRPGRAYVHVMKKDDILPLSDAVRTAVWEDAKASFNSPSLIGPPSVEFAIYKKVPSNKKRTDARQGTIDQDPEFMAFLEELANPAPPKETVEGEEGDDLGKVETKVTTTPLIEYLKEKKANKAKESSSSKNSKHGQDSRSAKGKNSSKDEDSGKKKGKESKAEKGEKTPKETVKILTKKATPEPNAETSKTNAKSQPNDSSAQETAPKSRRAGILAAARILQRDLGLSPGSAHRKARQDAAKAEADAKTPEKESTSTAEAKASASESPSTPVKSAEAEAPEPKGRGAANANKQQQSNRRTRGGKNAEKTPNPPIVLLKKKATDAESNPPAKPANTTTQAPAAQGGRSKADNAAGGSKGGPNKGSNAQKKPPTVSPDATRGFVKHANPSQGVTEALLKQTLSAFGTITFVEIDKRKGFAYVDFAEHEGLVKAVTASPIPVAQGTVQVLERKDKKPASTNANAATTAPAPVAGSAAPEKASGRGRRGRGGGNKVKDSGPNNQGTAPPPPAPANAGG